VWSRQLFLRAESQKLLSDVQLEVLRQQRILSFVPGLFGAHIRLAELGCLLDQNWLKEDVLNAMFEILHMRLATEGTGEAQFLTLPTHFYRDVAQVLGTSTSTVHHQFTPELYALNMRLVAWGWSSVTYIVHENDHYSLCHYVRGSGTIRHFDTLGRPPPCHATLALSWILQDVPDEVSTLQIQSIPVPHQGYTGRGSCGVGAFAHAIRASSPDTPVFTGVTSHLWRDTILRDLLLYALSAQTCCMVSNVLCWR
jgi:hypothetical protein